MIGTHHALEDLEGLPGCEIVAQGLADLERGVESKHALLALVAGPRLRGLGIDVPFCKKHPFAEEALYDLLEQEFGNEAHSQYNALIRRTVSFARAVEHEQSRSLAELPPDASQG